jgi:hypothetical protein
MFEIVAELVVCWKRGHAASLVEWRWYKREKIVDWTNYILRRTLINENARYFNMLVKTSVRGAKLVATV